MLDHVEIQTRDVDRCVGFYREVLAPVGYTLVVTGPANGFGHGERLDFWIVEGEPSVDVHYAFTAASRAEVDAAFACAACHGGRLDRPPALAPHIHPNYYAGYARDPDGRLVEFVSHTAD